METSRVKSVVRNQAEAKLNQLEHDEPAETMNQLQALKRKDEPTVAIQEARSKEESQDGAGTMKKSAEALSVDDISSDVIIQQEATME
ncbi:Dual specificity phosphatase Cdc25 [Dorcoceras hygrometricum]|uniref:Dual specificity phosphatase Cdc25 n=1 Tax=Dorcoceras hygrometricum TaxID=472368 RepID=A0A2Z7BJI0_9LAMI|nr:Dual specificity phosphatase Cdc25 [Dorcoceras hygrometricum]